MLSPIVGDILALLVSPDPLRSGMDPRTIDDKNSR